MIKLNVEAILEGQDAGKIEVQIGNTVHYLEPTEAEYLSSLIPDEVFKITGVA